MFIWYQALKCSPPIFIKGKSIICFSGYFTDFFVLLFQNTLIKTFVMEFIRVLGCTLQSCVSNKKWLHQKKLLEVLGDQITPTKMEQSKIFQGTELSREVVLQVTVKNVKFETHSHDLYFSIKDPTTRRALKTDLF